MNSSIFNEFWLFHGLHSFILFKSLMQEICLIYYLYRTLSTRVTHFICVKLSYRCVKSWVIRMSDAIECGRIFNPDRDHYACCNDETFFKKFSYSRRNVSSVLWWEYQNIYPFRTESYCFNWFVTDCIFNLVQFLKCFFLTYITFFIVIKNIAQFNIMLYLL